MSREEAPVVIDPVLCYVNSHRRVISDDHLRTIVAQYFADACISNAYDLLHQQMAPLLRDKSKDTIFSTTGTVEGILRIFDLCDRHCIDLPCFAVTDLNKLPPPPIANAGLDLSLSTKASSIQINNSGKETNDSLFVRRTLLKIIKEIKRLKSLVLELSKKNMDSPTAIHTRSVPSKIKEATQIAMTASPEEEERKTNGECPTEILAISTEVVDSPLVNGPPSTDDHSPSRDSRMSISRTTPPKRCVNARCSSSIEDAVAKIKAQRRDNESNMPDSMNCDYDDGESSLSKPPSPKMEIYDHSSRSTNSNTPQTKINGDMTSAVATRNLAAAMMEQSLRFPGAMLSYGLVNSAAATFLTNSGVLPFTAAVSPPERYFPPIGGPAQQNVAISESTNQNIGLLLRHQEQQQNQGPASASYANMTKIKKRSLGQTEKDFANVDPEPKRNRLQADGEEMEKPYACSYDNCNKRFTNKFLLRKHEFIHSGLKPFQCSYCLTTFNRKDNLLRHKSTHEKNDPNVCKTRRRRYRVFGVKGPDGDNGNSPSNLASSSAGPSSQAVDIPKGQRRAASCTLTDDDDVVDQRPNQTNILAPPSTIFNYSGGVPVSNEFTSALAKFTALAQQSHWPQAALSGVPFFNN